MKKFISVFFCLTLFCYPSDVLPQNLITDSASHDILASSTSFAEMSPFTPHFSETVIKFGYIPGFGFAKDLGSSSYRGYIYQLLRRMENFSQYEFTFEAFPDSPSLLAALQSGRVDVAVPMMYNQSREDNFLFGDTPFGSAQILLVAKGTDYGYYIDPQNVHGKTVASYHDSVLEPIFDEYCKKNGIKVNYIRGNHLDYHTLSADYYLVSSLSDMFQNYDSIISLKRYDYFLTFRQSDFALKNFLNAVYQDTITADNGLLPELFLQYYNRNITRRDLLKEEEEALKGKTFTVGYIRGHMPFQYVNEQGKPDGIAVEIFNLLADRYGFKVKYVPYDLDDPEEYHESFDLLLSLLGNYEHERLHYRRTEAYFHRPLMLITSKDNARIPQFQSKKRNIGTLHYISIDKASILREYPHGNIKYYPSFEELIVAYKNNDIDSMLLTSTALTYLNSIFGDTLFTFGNQLNLPFRLFVSRKLDPLYVDVFNVIFDYVNPGEFDEVLARHTLNFLPSYSFLEFVYIHRYEITIVFLVVLFVFAMTIYHLQGKKKMAVLDALRFDSLSGFMTYSFFEEEVRKIMKRAECCEYDIISIDIDSFKGITNHYSYDSATEILHSLAQCLATYLKGKHGLITRPYADNFIIIRRRIAPDALLETLNEKVVSQVLRSLGEDYPLTLSVGIYSVENCQEQVYIMVDRANVARNQGKKEHVTTVYSFDEVLLEDYSTRLKITYSMENALKNNEFSIVFQPKVDFKTLKLKGAEALVRWKAAQGGTFYPSAFIPVFEENGFIHKLDIYVFTKVCEFIQEYGEYLQDIVLSVNISSRSMLEATIVGRLKMIADYYQVPPNMIELEITESAMCEDFAGSKIHDFQAMGFSISIDDFGAGVSSLNRLGSMQADILKLDKAFLDVCDENFRGKVVVQDTILMAKHLDMIVVAEGVETAHQAAWLRTLDCDIAQGYYFSKPLPVAVFLDDVMSDKTYTLENINTEEAKKCTCADAKDTLYTPA